jgi:hypothetical protein
VKLALPEERDRIVIAEILPEQRETKIEKLLTP